MIRPTKADLIARRKEMKLTKAELARNIGVNESTLGVWESTLRSQEPLYSNWLAWCQALGFMVHYIDIGPHSASANLPFNPRRVAGDRPAQKELDV